MQNSISKSLVVVNNTLEAEGFALAKEWKQITKGDKARFTKATKADGFDTRLGKLMQKLKLTLKPKLKLKLKLKTKLKLKMKSLQKNKKLNKKKLKRLCKVLIVNMML